VKLKIKKYEYIWVDGKLHRNEVRQSNLKRYFNSVVVFLFKLINYNHVNVKDHNDKPMIKEILDIRGIRTCAYESNSGQVYICQFMWKFGKYYI